MNPTVQIVDAQGRSLLEAWPLSWAPPILTSPVDLYVTTNLHPSLDLNTDYRVHLPQDHALTGSLILEGGRNIVLIGGEITPTTSGQRGLYIKGSYSQTNPRTVHVEGLKVNGAASVDGIDLDMQGERQGIVQIQNCRVGDPTNPVAGNQAAWHADCLQAWNGPAKLRIDRLTGFTGYQGMMLQPRQYGGWQPPELSWDFRRVNLVGVDGFTDSAAYSVYAAEVASYAVCADVWGTNGAYQNRLALQTGNPGDFVPDGVAGRGYVSPGYLVTG